MNRPATDRTAPENFDAIALAAADNVATVLRAVAAGEVVRVKRGDAIIGLCATEAIPFCHKVALVPIEAGAEILKYGTAIGTATSAIAAGEHVHVHNLRSRRAQQGSSQG